MNKRFLSIYLGILILFIISGCNSKKQIQQPENNHIKIAAAIFPAYDWTKNILGDNPADAELSLLVDNGVDLHSYQPSVDDILTISNADIFIYVGGESDQWVTDALKQANNPDIRIISMLDTIGEAAREEELSEGMEAEDEAHSDLEPEYDEHVWLSLRNAAVICDAISAELSLLDPSNESTYQRNTAAYKTRLNELDTAYQSAIRESALKTLLFGDRFPFLYLTEDYGLDYYAAFSGCSAETEASFQTISFLAQKLDEYSLPAVLTIDGSDQRIAETIINNTESKNQIILTLDSMQSVSAQDISSGTTYLSIMEKNLEVLSKALKREEN